MKIFKLEKWRNVILDKEFIFMILLTAFLELLWINLLHDAKSLQIYKEEEKIVTYAENYARQENELADSEIEKVSIEILTRKKMYLIRLIVNNSEKKAFFLNYIIVLNDELDLQSIKPISDSEWTELILQHSKSK